MDSPPAARPGSRLVSAALVFGTPPVSSSAKRVARIVLFSTSVGTASGVQVQPNGPQILLLSTTNPPKWCCYSSVLQAKGKGSYRGPKPKRDLITEWLSNNDAAVRRLPIYVGGVSLLAVLLNRPISDIAPVADASSSQSRTDILALGLAVTNLLTGLVWLSIQPKSISPVILKGVDCRRMCSGIPDHVVTEILWAWDSLSAATCCRSMVIVYRNNCLLQIGVAAESSTNCGDPVAVNTTRLIQGSLYQGCRKSGKQTYLANLSLYPGRSELPFLPLNTQAVILQPLGVEGIIAIGGDAIRGFTSLDQAWITLIAEKLEATLSNSTITLTSVVKSI